MESKITIITVCYYSSNVIKNYIDTFLNFNTRLKKKNIEFIFVDNSKEKNLEKCFNKLKKNNFNFKVIRSENIGFSRACNLGAKYAKGDFLIFANPDIIFKSSIKNLAKFFNKNIWGSVYLIGKLNFQGLVIKPKKKNLFFEIIKTQVLLFFLPKIILKKLKFFITNSFVNGCFFCVRKKNFMEVGMFNENFFMYYEDVELSERLQKKYGDPFIDTETIIKHYNHSSSSNYIELCKLEANGFLTYINIIKSKKLYFKTLKVFKILGYLNKKYKHRFKAHLKIFPNVKKQIR